jgi:predicted cupin superfamily sugar epimerase
VLLEDIIQKLQLQPHPEGGFFKETYRSKGIIHKDSLPPFFEGKRNYSTCIYYLLRSGDFSAFHKINQDEIWHFYSGSPIKLYIISENGKLSEVLIGSDLSAGQVPQFIVPKHHWFAAKVIDRKSYSLLGCTVSPGFDFEDFMLASRKNLVEQFPQHCNIIEEFTRV